MSKLSALRKQIAALEAEFARTAKQEMEASVNKVKSLMAALGVTIEHLGLSSASAVSKTSATKKSAAKKAPTKKTAGKRAGAGVPKYMDPKSGSMWTGFGRAPGWIANARNRDVYLVSNSAAAPATDVKAVAKKVKTAAVEAAASAKKAVTRPAKKAAPAEAAAPTRAAVQKAAGKRPTAKEAAAKKASKKSVPVKKRASKTAAKKASAVAHPAPASGSSTDGSSASSQ